MEESTAFKHYYNRELAVSMAAAVKQVYPPFDSVAFVDDVSATVEEMEFKARIALFASALHRHLPSGFSDAWAILDRLLGDELTGDGGTFSDGFALWPLAQFIESYGLDDFAVSCSAMHEITKRHTAEFAIRPFLVRYPDRTISMLNEWVKDESPHVRRLVSEGTRPRLPWAGRLDLFAKDPSPTLALLEQLKDDRSPYVRKSVANHLNDIGKDHPQILLETCRRWQDGAGPDRLWIIRHALRTLIKQGNPDALELLGYGKPRVGLQSLELEPPNLVLGESLEFTFTLSSQSDEAQDLVIDFLIHFVKSNGSTAPKVFKLTTRTLGPGESVTIRKKHPIKPISTRRYYPGEHRLEIQVNGQILGGLTFGLELE
jgi:3-methyladenine DNA glycosylase AlkC